MFEDRLIEDGSVVSDDEGYGFELRLNWYRALPLSAVQKLEIRVDGELVDPGAVTFAVDGVPRRLEELPARWNDWWFVADSAEVRVRREGGLGPGSHELEVTLANRIPYLPTRGTEVTVTQDTCRRTVSV